MKILTRQLFVFAILLAVYTLAFRFGLSYFIGAKAGVLLWGSAVLYGLAIFFTAYYLGKADAQENPFFDLGLRFHVTTFVIWTIVSLGWFFLGKPNQWEDVTQIVYPLIIWSPLLLIHIIFFLFSRKQTIRGIRKDEIF
jgi:hypothetical protein